MMGGMKRFILLVSVLLFAGCKVKLDQSKASHSSTQEVFTSARETSAQEAVEVLAPPYEGDLKPNFRIVRAVASSDGGPEVIAELAFDDDPAISNRTL